MPSTTIERHFKNPPVRELILGIQFNPLPDRFSANVIPNWWAASLKGDFPEPLIRDRLTPRLELPESLSTHHLTQFLGEPFNSPRYWYASVNGERLVQAQQDMFFLNWRKTSEGENYPSFGAHFEQFKQIWKSFTLAWEEPRDLFHLPHIEVNQCEVTYVDLVLFPKGEVKIANVLNGFGSGMNVKWQQVNMHFKKEIKIDVSPFATLAFKIDFTTIEDFESGEMLPALQIISTVRGAPGATDPEGALEFFRPAKEIISETFFSIISDEVQSLWQ